MKIIFMGTPDFACPTLRKLIIDNEFEIVAVYTKAPQIAGRGHKLTNSAIHNLALENNLKVFTPRTLKDLEVQKEFISLKADVAVVVAYGLLLPQEILDGTKFGCINIHPSLLPRWRGAAPIQRTIIAGDKETGVDIIKMDKGLDSGEVIAEEKFSLNGTETYGELVKELSEIGANLLVKTLKNLSHSISKSIKQDEEKVIYAKKIEKSECEINWNESALEIERKIRGLSGSLGAFFMYNNEKIKIFTAEIIEENSVLGEIGKILNDKFHIQCSKGILRPLTLQRQGKNAMKIDEFLLGIKT